MTDRPIDLLTPGEVGALMRVDPKTVTRWANQGRLTSVKTPGGHRRYLRSQVMQLLQASSPRHLTLAPGHLLCCGNQVPYPATLADTECPTCHSTFTLAADGVLTEPSELTAAAAAVPLPMFTGA